MFHRSRYLVLLALAIPAVPARAADEPAPVIAHIKLSGEFDEATPDADPIFGGHSENLKAKIERIRKAKRTRTSRRCICRSTGLEIGWGKLDELTEAIADFRKSGKKVFAYIESGDRADYLLGPGVRRGLPCPRGAG